MAENDENLQAGPWQDQATGLWYNLDPESYQYYYIDDAGNFTSWCDESLNKYDDVIQHGDGYNDVTNYCSNLEDSATSTVYFAQASEEHASSVREEASSIDGVTSSTDGVTSSTDEVTSSINRVTSSTDGATPRADGVTSGGVNTSGKSDSANYESNDLSSNNHGEFASAAADKEQDSSVRLVLANHPGSVFKSSSSSERPLFKQQQSLEKQSDQNSETLAKTSVVLFPFTSASGCSKFKSKWGRGIGKTKSASAITTRIAPREKDDRRNAHGTSRSAGYCLSSLRHAGTKNCEEVAKNAVLQPSVAPVPLHNNALKLSSTLDKHCSLPLEKHNTMSELSSAFKCASGDMKKPTVAPMQEEHEALLRHMEASSIRRQIEDFHSEDIRLSEEYEGTLRNAQTQVDQCRNCFGRAEESQDELCDSVFQLSLLLGRWMTIRNIPTETKVTLLLQKYKSQMAELKASEVEQT